MLFFILLYPILVQFHTTSQNIPPTEHIKAYFPNKEINFLKLDPCYKDNWDKQLCYSHVLPQPVIHPEPPGWSGIATIAAGEMLSPLISEVACTTAMSFGEKPAPVP